MSEFLEYFPYASSIMMNEIHPRHIEPLSEDELLTHLDLELLPRHIAIIMDGNGRWAELRGLPRIAGHREGIAALREVVKFCHNLGIPILTTYAFSHENWNRPAHETRMLMELLEEFLQQERQHFLENEVRFLPIGRLDMLPQSAQSLVREVADDTQHFKNRVLTVALSYSGRSEIIDAIRQFVRDVQRNKAWSDDVNEFFFEQYLATYGLPDPDLLIRTSGETRISNFLLWQIAYTELYFTKTLWPDFRRRDIILALVDYQKRERRFGRVHHAVPQQSRS